MSQESKEFQVVPLHDPRIGFTREESREFMSMGFDTIQLLVVMLTEPAGLREMFAEMGKDFDDVVRRIKSVLPAEVLAEVEQMVREQQESPE